MPEIKIMLGQILKDRNLSQSELVHLTGIRSESISNLARNKSERVSLDHLAKIMAALDITDVNEILSYIPDKQDDPLGEPLEILDLPPDIYHKLKRNRLYSINTIRDLTNADLSMIRGIGPKRRETIQQMLAAYKSRHRLN